MKLLLLVAFIFCKCDANAKALRRGSAVLNLVASGHEAPASPVGENPSALEEMILNAVRSQGHSTPLADFVNLISPTFDQMENRINESHIAAQSMASNLTFPFTSCRSVKSTGEGEASTLLSTKVGRSTTHKACRLTEGIKKTAYDTCATQQNDALKAKTSACNDYDTFNVAPNRNLVPAPAGGSYKTWLESVSDWASTQASALETKRLLCATKTTEHSTKQAECEGQDGQGGSSKIYTDQKDTCNSKQSSLELAACSYAEKVVDVCHNYRICYDNAKTGWGTQLPNLQSEEASRKSEWRIVQRIRCYLKVISSSGNVDAAQVTACESENHDTAFLNIVYPALPSEPDTCAAVDKPCSSGYVTTEYSNLPSNAPAASCISCIGSTATATATTTTTTAGLPALDDLGASGHINGPMEECQGDCDNDSHCKGDLVCFQRSGFTEVPGCSGLGTESWDYCIQASG